MRELECDHVGCTNGCTTRAGMCTTCIRKLLTDHLALIKELREALVPFTSGSVNDKTRIRVRAAVAAADEVLKGEGE